MLGMKTRQMILSMQGHTLREDLFSGFLTRSETATEDGQRLEISDLGNRGIVLSM